MIAASTWVVNGDETIVVNAESHDDTTATIWLSAGTVGENIKASNRITTDSSPARTYERSLYIRIVDR